MWNAVYRRLASFPQSGRPGKVPETRELFVRPYNVVYRVNDNTMIILNIFHEAQQR